MKQPVAIVTGSDLERIIARDFPPAQLSEVRKVLAEYGKKDYHQEPERVRAAVLKLSGGSIERLRSALVTADQDWRDVICYAEYPRYLTEIRPSEKDEAKRQAVIDDDWKLYREWFEKKVGLTRRQSQRRDLSRVVQKWFPK